LEKEVRTFLKGRQKPSDFEKYFLAETLGHIHAGRYELACDSMDDVYEPPEFPTNPSDELCDVARSTDQRKLMRTLRSIEGTPTQEFPVFR
jgi:hypothetical protein